VVVYLFSLYLSSSINEMICNPPTCLRKGDLKPILETQGIQFPDIARVMSKEEHRSSLASTAGGG
jgi:hypothetical protein